MTTWQRISYWLMSMWYLVLTCVIVWYWLVDYSYRFEYESVEPASTSFCTEWDIFFVSSMEVKRKHIMNWSDRLYCSKEKQTIPYANAIDSNFQEWPIKKTNKLWRYPVPAPSYETTCRLQSNIFVNLPFSVEKRQVVWSTWFDIVHCSS